MAPGEPPRLGRTLAGRNLESWVPAGASEAEGALSDVAAFCARYCPVRLACVEEKCRLYRLEGRALEVLGLSHNPQTEAVGVIGQSTIGLG